MGQRDQEFGLGLIGISGRHPGSGAKLQLDVQIWCLGERTGQEI